MLSATTSRGIPENGRLTGKTRKQRTKGKMKLVSVNTGLPREVTWHGRIVTTGIFKQAVQGRVALRSLNLAADRHADLTVHGGVHKAVYCYPMEHCGYWRRELRGREL